MILEKNQDKTFTFDRTTGNLMKRTDEIQHLAVDIQAMNIWIILD